MEKTAQVDVLLALGTKRRMEAVIEILHGKGIHLMVNWHQLWKKCNPRED